jgi:predicted amidohydrolase/ribosomal protein S18 acetylase RimI-like enzyme
MTYTQSEGRLHLRPLELGDYPEVARLQLACFPNVEPWTEQNLKEQLKRFPEGQLCIEMDGEVVATSSALIVASDDWLEPHTFDEVSDYGRIRSHDPEGDTLYGIDIAVRPDHRGQRLGHRLYEHRKELIRRLNLRKMMIAGRIPNLHKHPDMSPEDYVRRAMRKELVDPTLTAQLAQGFTVRRVLRDYLPDDVESRGCAVLMEWHNPQWLPEDMSIKPRARVAAVQYRMRLVDSFEDFARQCTYYADLAADQRADFLLFPELLTNQLIPLVKEQRPAMRVRGLDRFTEPYLELFSKLAIDFNLNIIGGTHLAIEDGSLYNIAWLFHRDGRIDKQYKLHITPGEARWWGVRGGRDVNVFDTDCGKIAILICYDVEFPELARIARAKGANMLFVPYNTDLPSGHTRVRTCAQARCIENNLYVILSGMCGGLPDTNWAEIHFARSAILTPSDVPFPRDGVSAEAIDNIETLLVSDLDFARLRRMHRQGAVRTWLDRRDDLYTLQWHEGGETYLVE